MNLADEIRAQIEKNKGLKLAVGEINNHLSILEGLVRKDIMEQVDEAYQKGYDKGYADKTNNDEVGKELAKDVYQRGLDDAWGAARKIVCDEELDWNTLLHLFNRSNFEGIFGDFSPSEAIAKLKAYEEKQKADDEIKVGDERMKAKRVMHEDCAFLYWTCSKCNSLVLEYDNFCSNCGADFRRNEEGEEKDNDGN